MNARIIILSFGFLVVFSCAMRAQDPAPDVHSYIDQVTAGNMEDARRELPALQEKYPDDPGVLYLQALLTTDGSSAVRLYQSLVDNHPKSEWADAALYKVYQFYYSLGLYKTADLKMAQLQREYPDSKYLKGQSGIVEVPPPTANRDTAAPVVTAATAPVNTPPVNEHVAVPPVKPVSTPPAAKETTPRTSPSTGYALQLGAFASETNADRLRRAVEALGYRVEIVPRPHADKIIYHVWVGNYQTEAEARAAAAELRTRHSMDAILVTR